MDPEQASASSRRQISRPLGRVIFAILAIGLLASLVGMYRFAVARQTEPLQLTFKYRSVEIDAPTAQAIVSRHPVVPVKDSKYSWTLVSDAELAKLLVLDGQPAVILSQRKRKIDQWPMVAESDAYSLIVNAQKPNVYGIGGGLSAFLGARRIGSERQARIDGNAFYNRGGALNGHPSPVVADGKFFYEGVVPSGHLVFFAPLDKTSWHALIFEIV